MKNKESNHLETIKYTLVDKAYDFIWHCNINYFDMLDDIFPHTSTKNRIKYLIIFYILYCFTAITIIVFRGEDILGNILLFTFLPFMLWFLCLSTCVVIVPSIAYIFIIPPVRITGYLTGKGVQKNTARKIAFFSHLGGLFFLVNFFSLIVHLFTSTTGTTIVNFIGFIFLFAYSFSYSYFTSELISPYEYTKQNKERFMNILKIDEHSAFRLTRNGYNSLEKIANTSEQELQNIKDIDHVKEKVGEWPKRANRALHKLRYPDYKI